MEFRICICNIRAFIPLQGGNYWRGFVIIRENLVDNQSWKDDLMQRELKTSGFHDVFL